jgi:pimeloyl-ACP methyl ester carboxylesterase
MPLENNVWFRATTSKTVVVFVHGIFSHSGTCWSNAKAGTTWPGIVDSDPDCENVSIFLGGYPSRFRAGIFNDLDAAETLFHALESSRTVNVYRVSDATTVAKSISPLDKPRILFVCHSLGGIVVRRLLCDHPAEFKNKRVGILLCASPSFGSAYANIGAALLFFLRHRLLGGMKRGSYPVEQLDRAFQRLLTDHTIPDLHGYGLVETEAPFIPLSFARVVDTESATRYFPWVKIAGVSHLTLPAPASLAADAHRAFHSFATANFLTRKTFFATVHNLLKQLYALRQAYEESPSPSDKTKQDLAVHVIRLAAQAIEEADSFDWLEGLNLEALAAAQINGNLETPFYDFPPEKLTVLRGKLQNLMDNNSQYRP